MPCLNVIYESIRIGNGEITMTDAEWLDLMKKSPKKAQYALIDVNGALYIKLSSRGGGYTFKGNIEVLGDSENENLAMLKISYDNYGQTDMMVFHVKKDDGQWKIDSFESVGMTETSETSKEPTSSEAENTTDNKNTDASAEASSEAAEDSTASDNGDMEISVEMAYNFMNAVDYIDQLGGNGSAVDYYMDDFFDDHNGVRHVKVSEPGFTCVADVRNYLRSYLTDSYIDKRYSGLLDTDSPMLSDITVSTDTKPQLYSRYSPKSCGFQWTGKAPTIEKKSDDMYVIRAERDNYGAVENTVILIVRDTDGTWKIDSVN